MKSKHFSSIVAVTLTATVIGLTVIGTSNSNKTFFASASKESYGISFNSSKNKFHSYTGNTAYDGDATIQTNLVNDIDFSYYQVKGIASTWHVLGSGGYFYNTDPIHGIEKITLTFKTDNALFDIYYSIDDSFDQKQSFTSSVESPTVFNFDDYLPYYFKIVNTSGSNFNISSVDIALSCQLNYQTLTITNENEVMGSVSGSGIKAVGENVTITATPNPGYRFSGWYNGSKLVSSNNPYTFNMPYSDITYIAKFSTNSYELTLNNNNHGLGSITGSGTFLYGSSVTVIATPNTGVSFLGWYDNEDNLISSLATYTFNMPYEDLEYTAKFAWTPYSITIDVNDSTMGSVTGSGSYTYGQQVNLVATPNEHHSFFGWYLNNELVSQETSLTFNMPAESLKYEAKFVVNHYIYVYSDDESMGTVSAPSEWGEGLEVTVNANALSGYVIDYWYDDDLNEVSCDSEYTFVMPNNDLTLYAAFTTGYTLTLSSSDESLGT
ncbi:MAG: InlB B-repeat-containing protein, partial [Bacilli bacterium]|nr:InlB B-repeat-containing protein [Bacilli bacterium]